MNELRAWRRILAAAAVSGTLHAALITAGAFNAPAVPEDLPPLEVRVVTVAPPPAPATVRTAPRARQARPEAAIRQTTPVATVPPATDAGATGPGEEPAEEPSAAEETIADTGPADVEQPVVVATAPPTTFSPEPGALPAFPRSGRITYELVYGSQRLPVGRTVQSWRIDGTRYQLASRSETTGLMDFFRSQHRTYLSRGELTPQGLRPETFLMSRDRGRGRIEEGRAQFDWGRGTVTLGNAATVREETLPAGSQDIVSFIYQLAMVPPPLGRRDAAITNGTRLEAHIVEVLPEENIETPLGILRALPVRQVRKPGAESVDVWLAVEHRHLPVRMRFFNRDGEPAGEQIVTEIQLGTD